MFNSLISKSLVALCLLGTGAYGKDKPHALKHRGHFKYGTNPGMMFRLEQKSIDALKYAFQQFYPHYVTHDMNLPKEYGFDVGVGSVFEDLLAFHINWRDITYNKLNFLVVGTKVEFIAHQENTDYQKIHINFPPITDFAITAMQETDGWWVPALTGVVHFEIQQFKADITMVPHTTVDGFVHPEFHDVSVDFGSISFMFENFFVEFLAWQTIEFLKVMIENSIWFVGPYLLTDMMGPIIDRHLKNYQIPMFLRSPIDQDGKIYALMNWDLRHTMNPSVKNGFIDLFMMGELVHNDMNAANGCQWDPQEVVFARPAGKEQGTHSQLVLTENVVQCSLDNLMRSPIGIFRFNTERLNKMFSMFGKQNFVMDTTTVGKYLPLFPKKLGKGKPLEMILNFKNFDVKFGRYDTDVIIGYTACLDFRLSSEHTKTVFYDEIKVITSASVRNEDNVLYMKLLSHKLDNQNKFSQKSFPVKTTGKMTLTENEYREFLTTFGSFMNKQKQWLDKVVFTDKGLHLPMGSDQIKVQLQFEEGAMHMFFEIMSLAGQFLDEEWWDNDWKDHMKIPEHDSADWDWKDGDTWEEADTENKEWEDKMDKEKGNKASKGDKKDGKA